MGTAEKPAVINVTIGKEGEENADKPVVAQNIMGGGFYGDVYGDTEVTINNCHSDFNGSGSATFNCASGVAGTQYGNSKIVVNGGYINGQVAGGTMYGGVLNGNSQVIINGGTVLQRVSGGSCYGGGDVNGNTEVIVNGGTIGDDIEKGNSYYGIFGGSASGSNVSGNTKVIINGGIIKTTVSEKGCGSGTIGSGSLEISDKSGFVPTVKVNGEYSTKSLEEIFKKVKKGYEIEILTSEAEFPKNLPALNNVTIKGVEGKTTVKTLAEINADSTNLTFENIEFSQTTDTLKIQGTNVTFNNCDFNAKTLTYDSIKDTNMYTGGYSMITSIGAADGNGNYNTKNVTFNGCNFNGDATGETNFFPNTLLIANPKCENLTINNCKFSNAWAAIYYGMITGSVVVEDTAFDVYCYTLHNSPESRTKTTHTFKNTVLNGWTSYSGIEKASFEGCSFGGSGYQCLAAYKDTEFKNCEFSKDFDVCNEAAGIQWSFDNCTKGGKTVKRISNIVNFDDSNVPNLSESPIIKYDTKATVIPTVKTTGATVTLEDLMGSDAVEEKSDNTYKLIIKNASDADVSAANAAMANENDTNSGKQFFDISVVKIAATGTETDITDEIKNQPVKIVLNEALESGKQVNVYHVDGTNVTKVDSITDGSTVTFTASSFSTYVVTYTPVSAAEDTITTKVGVVFSPVIGTDNEYYIILKALDANKIINRFMAADLVFTNGTSTIDYEIEPALNMNTDIISTAGNSREYRFNVNGTALSGATGSGITIGKIKFLGYGAIDFKVDTAYISTTTHVNAVQTAKADDSIVDTYSDTSLIVNDDVNAPDYSTIIAADETGVIRGEIKPETKNLKINVKFNNNAENQAILYQDMHIVISGGDLTDDISYDLGSDNTDTNVRYDTDANGVKYYNVTVDDKLTKNTAYTVTVSGAGYRTTRYTVTMTENKELNFWNNAKDTPAFIEEGKGTAKETNFLAGDIVKDGAINIYDLSAVVSYFGTNNEVNAKSDYAKYDLNRDGKIDSKDVAYVLVSWEK